MKIGKFNSEFWRKYFKVYDVLNLCIPYTELKKEFVKRYIFQALKANVIYENKYLLGTSLARPLIAQKQIEIAQQENTNL